jgi:hypothetical protein
LCKKDSRSAQISSVGCKLLYEIHPNVLCDFNFRPKTECHDPSENETLLLDFLQSRLPNQNCAKNLPNHVIVVGAGISGLVAAQLLKDEGHKVTILESSNRVGGRIQTYR